MIDKPTDGCWVLVTGSDKDYEEEREACFYFANKDDLDAYVSPPCPNVLFIGQLKMLGCHRRLGDPGMAGRDTFTVTNNSSSPVNVANAQCSLHRDHPGGHEVIIESEPDSGDSQ